MTARRGGTIREQGRQYDHGQGAGPSSALSRRTVPSAPRRPGSPSGRAVCPDTLQPISDKHNRKKNHTGLVHERSRSKGAGRGGLLVIVAVCHCQPGTLVQLPLGLQEDWS
ncbi:unnamed protein product [Arctogadus glacialis]